MNIRQRIANIIAPAQQNALGSDAARDFLRNGPLRTTTPDWSQTVMTDRDKYTGFLYGAATRRANKVTMLATKHLKTHANDSILKAAKDKDQDVRHPYLDVIDKSPGFENDLFWRALQTWLDIKGAAYIMAVRGKVGTSVGDIKYFDLLWPFEITVVRDYGNMNVIGYVENRSGMVREIPPHMVIPIKQFNPFSRIDLFSMADAASDAQFALKENSEQMRTTARRNRKYPGVVQLGSGGEVALDPQQVENFKSRMRGKSRTDEPMFIGSGQTGKGGINWNDMQVDLRKSSVDLVNEVNLQELIAVSGASKTILGIEQSGVTRDSSETQDDLFTADHGVPALQTILDALNQDFKNTYEAEYKKTGYLLYIDTPLGEDKDAEKTDVENRTSRFELFQTARDAGYDTAIAAKYAKGEVDLDELGEPEVKPQPKVEPAAEPIPPKPGTKAVPPKKPANNAAMPPSDNATVQKQQEGLRHAVVAIQSRLVEAVISKVSRNQFEEAGDVVDETDRAAAEADLELALATMYRILLPLAAATTMSERIKEFDMLGTFRIDGPVNDYIKVTATRAAMGHVDTVLEDILKTVQETEERLVQDEVKKIEPKPGQTPESILKEARRLALEGNGREQIAKAIRETYADKVSQVRATTIARTETNRVYNRSQFEADRQFLEQNDLTDKAYKKWRTRSDNPCSYCIEMSKRPPIPFPDAFAKVGDTLKATFTKDDGGTSLRQMQVGFEDCMAGEIHPNGQCDYVLVIIK